MINDQDIQEYIHPVMQALLSTGRKANAIAIETQALWRETLTHMLGAGKHIPKNKQGYRNHFFAHVGGKDHKVLIEMLEAGLVYSHGTCQGGKYQYFHATEEGCKAIGLSKDAIERAMEL